MQHEIFPCLHRHEEMLLSRVPSCQMLVEHTEPEQRSPVLVDKFDPILFSILNMKNLGDSVIKICHFRLCEIGNSKLKKLIQKNK